MNTHYPAPPVAETAASAHRAGRIRQWAIVAVALIFLQFLLYGWWIGADVLLSDDYGIAAGDNNWARSATRSFRPLSEPLFNWVSTLAAADPQAIVWVKFGHTLLAGLLLIGIAVALARDAAVPWQGLAVAVLYGISAAHQVMSVWLITFTIVLVNTVTVFAFAALVHFGGRSEVASWRLMSGFSAALFLLCLIYQSPPFILAGCLAAWLVLTRAPVLILWRVSLMVAGVGLGAAVLYAITLAGSRMFGIIPGRVSQALDSYQVLEHIANIQPALGFHWGNVITAPGMMMATVLTIIAVGAMVDAFCSSARLQRLAIWTLATLIAAGALTGPALLNDNTGAYRLYAAGTLAASAFLVAAVSALFRVFAPRLREVAAGIAIIVVASLGACASAATVIGIGLPQHAELQYIRSQLSGMDIKRIERVHLIPPEDSRFWDQQVSGPDREMYALRMSSYHWWTRIGLVRFALRRVDLQHRILVTSGPNPPQPSDSVAVVDMRHLDQAYYRIPY